ncbi:MAG: type II toxin-antitoxin system TacA family antitoxin [Limisphaerales bacterium]
MKEKKSLRFVARVTAADKQLFQRAATIEGRSMATFVIAHAREVARQIINQNNLSQLNADESVRFVEALLAPPRPPTPALTDSIRAYRESVKSDLG